MGYGDWQSKATEKNRQAWDKNRQPPTQSPAQY